jgi:DNA-binding MltR family transcriptional regulator
MMAKKLSKFEHRMGSDEMRKEITNGPPRVQAIVAGALLEDVLRAALAYNLIELSESELKELFENNGPLATFSSRIKMAYALGLISSEVKHDLDVVRDIRNDFAHELRSIDLDHDHFRRRILGLHAVKDRYDRDESKSGDLLEYAVNALSVFLICRTSPSHLVASVDLMEQLKHLRFSDDLVRMKRDTTKDPAQGVF